MFIINLRVYAGYDIDNGRGWMHGWKLKMMGFQNYTSQRVISPSGFIFYLWLVCGRIIIINHSPHNIVSCLGLIRVELFFQFLSRET